MSVLKTRWHRRVLDADTRAGLSRVGVRQVREDVLDLFAKIRVLSDEQLLQVIVLLFEFSRSWLCSEGSRCCLRGIKSVGEWYRRCRMWGDAVTSGFVVVVVAIRFEFGFGFNNCLIVVVLIFLIVFIFIVDVFGKKALVVCNTAEISY